MIQLFCLQEIIELITQLSFQYHLSCIAFQFIDFYTLFLQKCSATKKFSGERRKAGEERGGNGDK